MKRLGLVAAIAVAILAVAQISTLAAQPLKMSVSFSPNPPQPGTETVTVRLTDGAHEPVNGAHVSVATSMPEMSMAGPTALASPKGNGRYVALLKIAFTTRWAFTVTAKSDGKAVSRKFVQMVQ